jgi:iron complex outermembrane receptor protein
MRLLILLLLGLFSAPHVWAQKLTGTVRDAVTGAELERAEIRWVGAGESMFSDEHGHFHLSVPPAGAHTLRIAHTGYRSLDTLIGPLPQQSSLALVLWPVAMELPSAVVSARLFQPPGGQQESVGQQYLLRNQRGTFVQALEKLPGVNAISLGVGVAKPVLRGLAFNRVVVSNDGVKQEGQQWGADHGLEVDPFSVEQAQVVKGPVSLQYGSDGLGGAVEVQPARAPSRGTWRAGLQGLWKSNNGHLGGSTWAQANLRDVFFMARYSSQAFGDFRVPADSFVYNGFQLPILSRRLKNTAGRENSLSLSAGLLRERLGIRITYTRYALRAGLFPGATGIPRAYDLADDGDPRGIARPSQSVVHQKVALHAIATPREGRLWKVVAAWQLNERAEFGVPDLHGRPVVDSSDVALGLRLETWSLNLQHERRHGPWQHTFGASAQWQRNRRSGFEFLLPDFSIWRSGVFGLTQLRHEKWLFSGGVRFELGGNRNGAYDLLMAFAPDGQPVYQRRTEAGSGLFSNVAAALKAAYGNTATDRWAFQASLGKSFRIPHPVETAANGVHHGTFRHEQGTVGLRTEHGWQLDLGADFRPLERWRTSAAIFGYFFQDYIYLGPTGQFSDLPEGGQLYRHQQNDALYAGAEWRLEYSGTFLQWSQSADFVWNQNLQTGLPLPFTPPARVQTEAVFFLPRHPEHYVRVTGRYVFAQTMTDRNEAETPSSYVLDVAIGGEWRIGEQRFQVFGEWQNVFDQAYYNHLSRYRLLNLPEQGRNLVLGLRLSFEGEFRQRRPSDY